MKNKRNKSKLPKKKLIKRLVKSLNVLIVPETSTHVNNVLMDTNSQTSLVKNIAKIVIVLSVLHLQFVLHVNQDLE